MNRRIQSGFTLLEILISIAIIAVLGVVLSQVFISTMRTNTKTEYLKEVKQTGDLAVETLARMIQNAYAVTCVSDKELEIQNPDGNTTTIACTIDGAILRLASSSATITEYITSEGVTLGTDSCATSALSFDCTETSGQRTMVTISFTLSRAGYAGGVFEEAEHSFQTSAVVRSSVQ